jgi:hypothetical protein
LGKKSVDARHERAAGPAEGRTRLAGHDGLVFRSLPNKLIGFQPCGSAAALLTSEEKIAGTPAMELLKLVALDKDDLEVVSAHLQDSEVRVAEILWRPKENRLVLAMDRFDWEAANGDMPAYRRRRAALRFERVLACKCRNVASAEKEKILNLLAVDFSETSAPAGVVTLMFDDGAALRLEVECLECEVADLGPVWDCEACPDHSKDEVIGAEAARR